jgi:SAM-dependent methyltransferase
MAPTAAYDQIADWYEHQFLGGQSTGARTRDGNPLNLDSVLRHLLGEGSATCLEIGCGAGTHAIQVRGLGWTPIGVDLSAGMLRHARGRLPVAQADAEYLPIPDHPLPAVIAMMVHTDMPAYLAVLREVARVLRPGWMFVHVGVHRCFCGGFADRSDLDAIVIRPGYLNGHWTKASWTDYGVRARVGAIHRPLPELMHAFLDAGLQLERFAESGEPTPVVLAIKARKSTEEGLDSLPSDSTSTAGSRAAAPWRSSASRPSPSPNRAPTCSSARCR